MLYAAYSGNMDVIKYLVEEHRVNEYFKTSNGLNALHLASQKNMVSPFLYFRGRISLEDVDDMNSTPLHWAAYMNSEEVVSYILSTSSLESINLKDS
jgi:ankyrin repeat protein